MVKLGKIVIDRRYVDSDANSDAELNSDANSDARWIVNTGPNHRG